MLSVNQNAPRITNSPLGVAHNRSEALELTDLHGVIEDAPVLLEREMNKYGMFLTA